jgi:hypothetical protein
MKVHALLLAHGWYEDDASAARELGWILYIGKDERVYSLRTPMIDRALSTSRALINEQADADNLVALKALSILVRQEMENPPEQYELLARETGKLL